MGVSFADLRAGPFKECIHARVLGSRTCGAGARSCGASDERLEHWLELERPAR